MSLTDDDVRGALERVIDPELDASVVALDFVQSIEVTDGDVNVALRLPTYWCSPNFAWLMVSDAQDAVGRLPGAERVRIELVDHFAGPRISDAVDRGMTFQDAFPDQADGELSQLRRTFQVKAFIVRQAPVLAAARRALGDADVVREPMREIVPSWAHPVEWAEYLSRRADLGIESGLAFTDARGHPLEVDELDVHVRLARSTRVSLQSNTEFCTGLLAARYDGVEEWQRKEVMA